MTAQLSSPSTASTTRALTVGQRTRLRTQLTDDLLAASEQEARIARDIAEGIESRRGSSNDETDDPEGSNLAFEGAQSTAMLRQVNQHAAQIAAALARLDAGTYGVCVGCGEHVAFARLEARPATDHCIRCAS